MGRERGEGEGGEGWGREGGRREAFISRANPHGAAEGSGHTLLGR